ncbi:hypothetical protein GGS26DRAFT_433384 [Hypomontagnella submonticulosa]|nr:hypothetical protein GGS26DRAFT_433384 [Hypomontagnella submonticulosa]
MSAYSYDPDYVDRNRPNPPYRPDISNSTVSPPTTESQVTIVHDPARQPETDPNFHQEHLEPSPISTIVPYAPTPPPAPTPPSIPSESEIYGPDRLFGHQPAVTENVGRSIVPSPGVRFDQPQFPPMAVPRDPAFARDFKDDLARAAGVVTPGVDDGPYIRYALDALTGVRDNGRGISEYPSSESDESYQQPTYHFTPTTVPSPVKPSSADLPPEVRLDNRAAQLWPIVIPPPPVASSPERERTVEEELAEWRRQGREKIGRLFEYPYVDPMTNPVATTTRDRQVDDQASPDQPKKSKKVRLGQIQPRTLEHWQPRSDALIDPEMGLHNMGGGLKFDSPLTLKPWVLRSQSLLLLTMLCVLMIAALVFSAIYSTSNVGLTQYAGTIYGGQYFLFRILPQLLAVIILIYAQCVITAAFWVLPFSAMASDDRNERRDAVFLPLYPKSFLWPQLVGDWNIWIPILNVWLLNFTIPLQSSLFTVILVDGTWTWATVQGVAWTLVALYVSFLLALGVMMVFWHKRRTGMMRHWCMRTIGDIIFLVSQSNSLAQYRGLETATTRRSMKQRIGGTAERLGFWFTPEIPELSTWYGIGMSTGAEDIATEKLNDPKWADRLREEEHIGSGGRAGSPSARYRYLPWCFRDSQLLFLAVACSILLIALLVVSFVPATDLRKGFLPQLNPAPVAGAFSAADFLYSFIPSLLGLILFLLFQPLDMTLRILTPWGELSRPEGSRAKTSLLLDYSTCLPFEVTYKALRNKHWRVAFVSLLSPLFTLLPVLAGGLFLALTPTSGIVRMYPNVPAFAIILTLLFLYVAALMCLIPNRKQFRLPHAVTCLAEIISFCCDEQVRTDEAFDLNEMMVPQDLAGKLDVGKDWHRQGRWIFTAGRNNDERLGIKRLSKYTVNPKKLRAYDKRARGQLISQPLPSGSSSLFNQR